MNLFHIIDAADVLDMIIVAIFVYVGLIWFKKTKSFLVVVGIVILGAVYALAKYFNLFLTSAILQGFFGALLIAIIVIFQEDLRHFFEKVAMWGLRRGSKLEASPMLGTIVRSAIDCAHEKVGALIIIVGKDPIERHLEGGTGLDGKISEAIVKSIFDNSSPGHDGAIIIRNGRIVRFAAHLPLSKNLTKLVGLGTRHAAALGLSERCDALCIIVSEERGTISIARDGDLIRLPDPEAVGEVLSRFMNEKFPIRRRRRFTNIFRKNFPEKATAILMSAVLWTASAYNSGLAQRDFTIPIEYSNLPADLSIVRSMPNELTITVSGEERSFKILNLEAVKAVVDVAGATEGYVKIPVQKGFVTKLPRNLSLDGIKPAEINLILKKGEGGVHRK